MTGQIVIVDEVSIDGNNIVREAHRSGKFDRDELLYIYPEQELSAMISMLIEANCELLISDFRLGERDASIHYSGIDLVSTMRETRDGLPCFLATSYPVDAIREKIDPKLIFSKEEIHAERAEGILHFFDRARAELDGWRSENLQLQETHAELLKIAGNKKAKMTAEEVQRLIDIDTLLEKRIFADPKSSAHVKQLALSEFDQIVSKANELIVELEQKIQNSNNSGHS